MPMNLRRKYKALGETSEFLADALLPETSLQTSQKSFQTALMAVSMTGATTSLTSMAEWTPMRIVFSLRILKCSTLLSTKL